MSPSASRTGISVHRAWCVPFALAILFFATAAVSGTPRSTGNRIDDDWNAIPGLTGMERVYLQAHHGSRVGNPSLGPVHYVAPGIRVIETQGTPSVAPFGTLNDVRTFLTKSNPLGALAPVLTNGGFEDGTFLGWTTVGNLGSFSPSVCADPWPADAFITNPGLLAPTNNDPCINMVFDKDHSARLGDETAWGFDPSNEPKCSAVQQDAVIPAGTSSFVFAYAVMAENPGHGFGDDPYFEVRVDDISTATNIYDVKDYTTSFNPLNPCQPWCAGVFGVVYRCWTTVNLDLSAIAGHTVRVSLLASDCSPSGHYCSAFLDGAGIPCRDSLPPDGTTLTASCRPDSSLQSFCATLHWTSPSDQTAFVDSLTDSCVAGVGPAAAYDIRWSTSPILTPADFAAANQVGGEPVPAAPGSPESMVVCGLPPGIIYFALQSFDASFNTSATATASTNCSPNQDPDCTNAVASEPVLWPPNHAYHAISILGVTDPDGDPVTITVTGITQDEPTNTRGDGNTCPDGLIQNGQASVRAERTGTPSIPGNGRVYVISFTADDGKGGTCSGSVSVCVPHDMGDPTCVNDGQRYASTGPCQGGNTLQQEVTAYGLDISVVSATEATVAFAIPKDSKVQIGVYDVAGRRLALLENGTLPMGMYQRTWNMSGAAKGVYFVRMSAAGTTISKTLLNLH